MRHPRRRVPPFQARHASVSMPPFPSNPTQSRTWVTTALEINSFGRVAGGDGDGRVAGQNLALTVLYLPYSLDSGKNERVSRAQVVPPRPKGSAWTTSSTAAIPGNSILASGLGFRGFVVQGYLTYKKTHLPRTLQ